MRRKTMLFAVAALGTLAFAALPGVAMGFETTPAVSLPSYPQAYTSVGGATTLFTASGRQVTCSAVSGEGSLETAHTGSGRTRATGCKESTLGSKCTTSGQESGTVTTEILPAHTVYLKPANAGSPHERPGILITPNANGTFATFSCASGLVKITIKGNGVLGTVIEPALEGAESNTSKVSVAATAKGQEHTETVEGQKFGLESNTNGGAFEAAYLNSGTETATLSGGVKGKTTTETP